MSHCIEVSNLTYSYDKSSPPALSDVSFTVNNGSIFGLLGPNGAGKTTLISLLTGTLSPQQGRIKILDNDLSRDIKKIKSVSATVPQDYAFYPALTGKENLKYFSGLYGISKAELNTRMAYCAEVCGLEYLLDKKSSTYSGGVKRRLNLAIGLLNQPEILYLDEPTVGIDAQSRNFILQAIKALQAEGMTIIYTSHYMEEIQSLCDDIAVIDHGKLLIHQKTQALLNSSKEKLLQVVLEQPLNTLQQNVLNVFEWTPDKKTLQVPINWAAGEMVPLLKMLEEADVAVESMQYGISHLESVYLSLTKQKLRE